MSATHRIADAWQPHWAPGLPARAISLSIAQSCNDSHVLRIMSGQHAELRRCRSDNLDYVRLKVPLARVDALDSPVCRDLIERASSSSRELIGPPSTSHRTRRAGTREGGHGFMSPLASRPDQPSCKGRVGAPGPSEALSPGWSLASSAVLLRTLK